MATATPDYALYNASTQRVALYLNKFVSVVSLLQVFPLAGLVGVAISWRRLPDYALYNASAAELWYLNNSIYISELGQVSHWLELGGPISMATHLTRTL